MRPSLRECASSVVVPCHSGAPALQVGGGRRGSSTRGAPPQVYEKKVISLSDFNVSDADRARYSAAGCAAALPPGSSPRRNRKLVRGGRLPPGSKTAYGLPGPTEERMAADTAAASASGAAGSAAAAGAGPASCTAAPHAACPGRRLEVKCGRAVPLRRRPHAGHIYEA